MTRAITRKFIAVITFTLTAAACASTPGPDPTPTSEPEPSPTQEVSTPTEAPPVLGSWEASCEDSTADLDALQSDLTEAVTDSSPLQEWARAAAPAAAPLGSCDPLYLLGLADVAAGHFPGHAGEEVAKAVLVHALSGSNPVTTKISHFSPFDEEGRISLALERPQEYSIFHFDTCWESLVGSTPDIYRCGSSALRLPACWRADDYGLGLPTFVCMHDPGDDSVMLVASDDDVEPVPTPEHPFPWSAELADGATCSLRLGGAWPPAPEGYIWTHSCSGGQTQGLLVDEDTRILLTTVDEGLYVLGASEIGPDSPVSVLPLEQALFAGQRPPSAPIAPGKECPSFTDLAPALREVYPRMDFLTHSPPECALGWAFTMISDEVSAAPGVFREFGGSWVMADHEEVCTLPTLAPADIFAAACLAG